MEAENTLRNLLAAIGLTCPQAFIANENPVKVHILSGQPNMAGIGQLRVSGVP